MNRISLNELLTSNKIELGNGSNNFYLLDLNYAKDDEIILSVNGGDYDILTIPCRDKRLYLDIQENSNCTFSFLAKYNLKNFKISAKVSKNSTIVAYFADFSTDTSHPIINIDLDDEHAQAYWHLASLAAGTDNKEFEVSINHNSKLTFAKSDNYGVCKNDGRLVFSGTSRINNGCKKSKTSQNAKIMVFDRLSNAAAKPILKIDENDIEANHAAVVGKISDEHLFYLTSRGLSEEVAKELITFGYLKPILNGFIDDEIKEEINSLIERRM